MSIVGNQVAPIMSDPTYTGSTAPTTTKKSDTLGKQDFLTLLMAQLKNQDPLNPMKDTEFVSQLASFSSLEQTTAMNKNLEALVKNQQYQNSSVAVGMIGKEITGVNGENGVVTSVAMDGTGGVSLTVGDKQVALTDIREIKNAVVKN